MFSVFPMNITIQSKISADRDVTLVMYHVSFSLMVKCKHPNKHLHFKTCEMHVVEPLAM